MIFSDHLNILYSILIVFYRKNIFYGQQVYISASLRIIFPTHDTKPKRHCIFARIARTNMKTINVLLAAFILTGCAKSKLDPQLSLDVDYCPMTVGCWIDYAVTAIKVDVATEYYDTARYVMREEVDAMLDSSAAEQKYRIIRKVKLSQNSDWQDLDAILVIKNIHSLIRQENNIPEISISYPVAQRKSWHGYAFNSDDTANFRISKIFSEETFSNITFDSVLTVVHIYSESLIDLKDHSEQYAAGIGLVERHSIDAYTDKPVTLGDDGKPLPLLQRAETATIYRQTFLAQGKK